MSDGLSLADTCDLLRITPETLRFLTASGPLEARNDRLTSRQVFGVALLLALGMLTPADATSIAMTATLDAEAERGRVLVISWRDKVPVARWFDTPPSGDGRATLPYFVVDADRLLAETINRVAERNAARSRPN